MNNKIITAIINCLFYSYKAISAILPCSCRFYPSCSEYSRNAISKYGMIRGLDLTIRRLFKCNPLFTGGYDPVD